MKEYKERNNRKITFVFKYMALKKAGGLGFLKFHI